MKRALFIGVALLSLAAEVFAWSDPEAEARAKAVGIGGAVGPINFTSRHRSYINLPNSADTVVQMPNRFTTNGPGLAEQTAQFGALFARLCGIGIPANLLSSPRSKIITDESDYASMLWQPYGDYVINPAGSRTGVASFSATITDIGGSFGNMDPHTTYYCLGHIAARTPYDQDVQDLVSQETLVAEAMRFAAEAGLTGFAEITPVVLGSAFYEGVAAEGNGISITPQASGGPGVSVAAGSMFSWQQNRGMASPSYGSGIKILLLARAPGPNEGHKIAAEIRKINAAAEKELKDEEKKRAMEKPESPYVLLPVLPETSLPAVVVREEKKEAVPVRKPRVKSAVVKKKVKARRVCRCEVNGKIFEEIR